MTSNAQAPSLPDPAQHGSPSAVSGAIAHVLRSCPPFRGKARLQGLLLPREGIRRASVYGFEMDLDLADVIQRDVYAGVYEAFEAHYLRKMLRPGMRVLDVGANIGYYTWLAASLVGRSGRVISFEPGPYAFERLQRVVRENQIGNVELRQIALSDRTGRATLYVPKRKEGNYNPSLSPYLPDMDPVEVAVGRLDDLLPPGKVDLMKVDVEGHELLVFRGAGQAVREKRIGAILCEFNEGYQEGAGWSCDQLESWFTENKFTLKEKFPSTWGTRVHNRLYVVSA